MRSALPLSLLLLFAGCGPSVQNGGASTDVTLEVEPTSVRPGGTVELVLDNQSSGAIGYNLCTSALERQTDGGWDGVVSDRVCTMELRTLAAGQVTRYPYELPAEIEPGEYRFLANVEMMDDGGRRSVWTGAFTVEG